MRANGKIQLELRSGVGSGAMLRRTSLISENVAPQAQATAKMLAMASQFRFTATST